MRIKISKNKALQKLVVRPRVQQSNNKINAVRCQPCPKLSVDFHKEF